ncbi:hypothetical protein B9Z19DRAFT_941781, partial [Tuber borchii]
ASPDLNPIERVWDYIRQKISQRARFPTTKEATIKAWHEEWSNIPLEVTDKFIRDVKHRIEIVAAQEG